MYLKFKILSTLLVNMLSFGLFAQQQTDTLIIFFDLEKSVVDNNNSAELLDKLIANKNIISIRVGYPAFLDSIAYNQQLSEGSVYNYLTKLFNKYIANKNQTSINIYGFTDFLGSIACNQQLLEKRCTNMYNHPLDKEITVFSREKEIHSSVEKTHQDFSDKGIKAPLKIQVVYNTKLQDLAEEDFVPNNYIVLENILFYNRSLQFTSESYPDLEELFEIMQKFNTLKIEIQGHVCCNHEISAGLLASTGRAKAVYDYLVEKGIDSTRMIYKGFGSTRKRYPLERDEYEMAMNRRVEILILEK